MTAQLFFVIDNNGDVYYASTVKDEAMREATGKAGFEVWCTDVDLECDKSRIVGHF